MRSAILLVSVWIGGCYLSHERARPRAEPGRADAGVDAWVEPPIDASARPCLLTRIGEIQVRDAPDHSSQAPDLYWTRAEVGVVMSEMDGDIWHPLVSRVLVQPDLSRVSEPVTIGEESHGWGEAAWTGTELALCWHGDPGGNARTMYRRFFEPLHGPSIDIDADGEACLDLVSAGGRVFLSWRHPVGDRIETHAQVRLTDGSVVTEPFVLAEDAYPGRTPSLFATEDAFFSAIARSDGVEVRELSLDGELQNRVMFPIDDARSASIAVAHDRVALLVATGPIEVRSLALSILDRSLITLEPFRSITYGAPTALHGTVVPAPDGFFVHYTGGRWSSSAMLLHFDADGIAREARHVAYRGASSSYGGPSMVHGHGADFYFGLSHATQPDSAHHQVFVQHWRCEPHPADPCAPQDVTEGDCDGSEQPRWRWTGVDCAPVVCPSACGGSDCERLFDNRYECISDYASCSPMRECRALVSTPVDGACIERNEVRQGEPIAIGVSRALRCPCASLLCDVAVTAPFELTLMASYCESFADCDCEDPEREVILTAPCHVPPIAAGAWTVRGDGFAPFPIEVKERWETAAPARFCTGG